MSNTTTTRNPARSSTGLRLGIVVWFAVVIGGWIAARFLTDVDTLLLIAVGVVLLIPAQLLWNRTKRS